jgi:hypothetical protein
VATTELVDGGWQCHSVSQHLDPDSIDMGMNASSLAAARCMLSAVQHSALTPPHLQGMCLMLQHQLHARTQVMPTLLRTLLPALPHRSSPLAAPLCLPPRASLQALEPLLRPQQLRHRLPEA